MLKKQVKKTKDNEHLPLLIMVTWSICESILLPWCWLVNNLSSRTEISTEISLLWNKLASNYSNLITSIKRKSDVPLHTNINLFWSLNSEEFWPIHKKAHTRRKLEVQKNAESLSDILDYSWFLRLFRGFLYKTFEPNISQPRLGHHKICHKISRRTVFGRSLGSIGHKWFYTKSCPKMGFNAGSNCVGLFKIKLTYTK